MNLFSDKKNDKAFGLAIATSYFVQRTVNKNLQRNKISRRTLFLHIEVADFESEPQKDWNNCD
jgi:hypothetical protein